SAAGSTTSANGMPSTTSAIGGSSTTSGSTTTSKYPVTTTKRGRSTTTRSNVTTTKAPTTPKAIATPGKGSCEKWNSNFQSIEDCMNWYKQNGMIVNVYFESLEYQVLTEAAAYSLSAAINDLGGQ
ncbi:hypothetical protein PFISCL1PPCAC_27777, partial [Pristionchus fissidentatus]